MSRRSHLAKGPTSLARESALLSLLAEEAIIGLEGDEINCSPTHQLESQSSGTDDLPPTPTKSTTTTINNRPQSKGKSNSLRSSLFGRRTSLGPDTFASPADEQQAPHDDDHSKYTLSIVTPHVRTEKTLLPPFDESPMPFITLTTCASPSPSFGSSSICILRTENDITVAACEEIVSISNIY